MIKEYLNIRRSSEHIANVLGVVLAILLPGASAATLSFTGLKYLYPPPEETSFVLDFTQEEELVKPKPRGRAPRAENVDKKTAIELVQKSESPYKAVTKTNATPATRPDNFGDVDTPAVEKEDALDPRASFPGMSKKDTSTTAPHSAKDPSESFKGGQPDGNTKNGKTEGSPNAHLKGRNTVGSIAKPRYNIQKEGIVVVAIRVNQYGVVRNATPGAEGTTVTDKNLWEAAKQAALETHFNQAPDAPALQEGTITYYFKLK